MLAIKPKRYFEIQTLEYKGNYRHDLLKNGKIAYRVYSKYKVIPKRLRQWVETLNKRECND